MGLPQVSQTSKRHSAARLAAEGYVAFYRELARRFNEIGSILPSSKALAEDITSVLHEIPQPRTILEVGPGTGPFTKEILARMKSSDSLTVCEINGTLLSQLQKMLNSFVPFQRHKTRVQFIEAPVQELSLESFGARFDVIICGLPFSIFDPVTAEEIMQRLHAFLKPGGRLVFFEYWGVREIFGFVNTPQNRERLRAIDRIIDRWERRAELTGAVRKHVCFQNIPPAKVLEFQF